MADETRVLYNGECPVCSREMNHYARYVAHAEIPLRFDDMTGTARGDWGIDADTAARQLHVIKDGVLYAGLPAFLVLWAEMPRYRWLARIAGLPLIRPALSALYDHVLAPRLYRWHKQRSARGSQTGT